MKKNKIENWEGKIYDFLSPVNLTMFREERTEKVISFVKELLQSEREEWEKEKIMAIDKRILDKIKREQGTDEFYETIVKPIEKRVKNQLLEKIKLEKFEI